MRVTVRPEAFWGDGWGTQVAVRGEHKVEEQRRGDEEKDGVGDEAEVAANPLMEEWRLSSDKWKMP